MDGTAPQLPLADALAHAERFLKEGNKDAAGALYQDILAKLGVKHGHVRGHAEEYVVQ